MIKVLVKQPHQMLLRQGQRIAALQAVELVRRRKALVKAQTHVWRSPDILWPSFTRG